MHIVILADPIDNQNAGVHIYTARLIENLLKIDKENRYTFIHERKNDFFNGLNHHIIPRKNHFGAGTYRKFFLIPRLIKKLKPDIVLEPCHIGPFRISKKIKRVVTVHDLTPILFPQFHIRRSTIVHKILFKRVLRHSDLILTASENTKQDILNYSKTKAKIAVIPLGIDPPKTNPPRPTIPSSSKPIPSPYILYLGTIEPRKNLNLLIETFLELKKSHKIPHKLVLAGEIGWKSNPITEKASHPDILITNFVTEDLKASLYAHANIFLYPSIYEGFGLPPLEAMSYGVPVICSTGGSLKEIYSDHALMFAPNDKKSLKSHILSLIKNTPSKNTIEKANTYARSFTWEKTAEKILKELQILNKKFNLP